MEEDGTRKKVYMLGQTLDTINTHGILDLALISSRCV